MHSPSDHAVLDDRDFQKDLYMRVHSETLDLNPGLIGDENGLNGVVVSRYYHHVTGTPMFQMDFGGGIGNRSIRMSDTVVDIVGQF